MIGLGRSLSGLRASEAGIRISTNNLTNVNTKGYKRQRLIQSEEVSTGVAQFYVGLGTRIDGVQQLYNQLKEDIYQNTLAKYGEYEAIDKTYDYVQTLTGTVSEGGMFKTATEDLWKAMNLLSTDTSSLTYRMSFLENAISFINQSEEIMNQLSAFQKEINEEIKGCVTDINRYADEIDRLNKKLAYYEAMDMDTNEVRDKRAYAIEQLSQIVEVDVENCRNGTSLAIRVGGGYLVSETQVYPIELGQAQEGSLYDIPIWSNSGAKVDVKSGKLKGLLESRGYNIVGNLEDPTNGSPNEKVDIVVTIDPLMDNEKVEEIRDKISAMLDQMDRYQADYKLYINYAGYDATLSFDSREEFEDALQGGVGFYGDGVLTNSMNSIKNTEYRENANKYMLVFTDRPINGDASTTKDELYSTIKTLKELNMRVIAVTDEENTPYWRTLTDATNGSVYDISNIETEEGFGSIGVDLVHDINTRLNENDFGAIIPNVKAELNTFVNILVREINALLQGGTNVYGETNNDGSLDMFLKIKEDLPWQIGNIKINPLYSDTNKMPFSLSGDIGDNRIIADMVALREANVFSDMNRQFTLDGFYSNFVLELGTNAGHALTNLANQENVVQDADDKRKQISAVSSDEELSNIIKYQYAYTASSKMINVIDEMLDTMVNMI